MAKTARVSARGANGRTGLRAAVLVGITAAALQACTHAPWPEKSFHYATFKVPQPRGSTVHVCHAYGCREQTKITFSQADITEIAKVMKSNRKDDSAAEERRAIAYAIGHIERHVGGIIGTSADRPGMDFTASGDRTQQDCVDEATNTTSYLLVLQNNGLLKHHTVGTPFAKDDFSRGVSGWTHWTAVLNETGTPNTWAVDSWIYANGENPAVVETAKWYIASLDELPKSTH